MRPTRIAFVLLTLFAGSWTGAVHGQGYPTRPVRVIVPWPPGGTADTVARLVMQRLSESFRQQFVIDNRAGASTIIGTELAAKASQDGYTLFVAPFNFAVNPSLFKKLPYRPTQDFTAVALFGTSPIVLVVNPGVPVRTVPELVRLARTQPGKLNYASAGKGSSNHLAGERFRMVTGADIRHVPYKGGAPAATAVAAGEVQLMFSATSSAISHIRAGRIIALAVAHDRRSPALPDVQTLREAGVDGAEVGAWHGLIATAGTPNSIVRQLGGAVTQALKSTEVHRRLVHLGFNPVGGTPDQFTRFINDEIGKWRRVVGQAGISPN